MKKKRILIITTGGTIAMRYESEVGVVPSNGLIELLNTFEPLNTVAEIAVKEFSNLPSPHITPQKMLELAKEVDQLIDSFDGVVITHGTDTLEETAYLLDLVLKTRKSVVFTAAMRSGNAIGLDGPRNIISAVRVAAHESSVDKGVLVVLNDEIHTARDVMKADTSMVNSFVSPGYGKIGYVDTDDIIYHCKNIYRENIWTDKIDSNVDLIKVTTGMDDRFLRASLLAGAKGIVLEAFGRGNIPPNLLPTLRTMIHQGIIVVIVSRVTTGRVLPEYGYVGGCKDLVDSGAILGGDLKGPKARIKLMCLLGKYEMVDFVKRMF